MSEDTVAGNGTQTDEQQAPMPDVRVDDILRFSINLFNEQAWIQLGIRANPATGETTADLEQAKLAIDALTALIQLTEGRFDAHEVRDLKNLLAGLQMNFVQRKSAQG